MKIPFDKIPDWTNVTSSIVCLQYSWNQFWHSGKYEICPSEDLSSRLGMFRYFNYMSQCYNWSRMCVLLVEGRPSNFSFRSYQRYCQLLVDASNIAHCVMKSTATGSSWPCKLCQYTVTGCDINHVMCLGYRIHVLRY